jgi:ATP-dependent helicase HepA
LTRWFHEGLNAFARNLEGGNEILERFGARVHDLTQHFLKTKLQTLIEDTKTAHAEITQRLHEGRDKLLELNSFRRDVAQTLVQEIEAQDGDASLDEFMLRVFDQQAVQTEELAYRTYRVGSAGVLAESFPGLPADGFTVTADRRRALVREDIQFLTWDHPLVTGAIDLLLGSEKGNSSFGYWAEAKTPGLFLEAVYVLESVAPPQLHVDRFLPPTPLWIFVDHHGKDSRKIITREGLAGTLETGEPHELLDEPAFREQLLPRMLSGSQDIANREAAVIVAAARKAMSARLTEEITRLQELRQVNKSVRREEIDLLLKQQKDLDDHIAGARLRLDAIRLIDAVS